MNPFQTLSMRKIYENPWIEVVEHQVLNPRGKQGIYGVVKFKNKAVGVIPYEDGCIWMVGQHRFPLDLYSWEIPEGGSPQGESLLETAQRELQEETGLTAESFERILEMHLSNSVTDEYGVVFLARGLRLGPSAPEDTEDLQLKKIPLSDAYRMVNSGEITDSLSVAAILKLVLKQKEGSLT